MRVPKEIKEVIKQIERISLDLSTYERELYTWLDTNGINCEDDSVEDDICLDLSLDCLFHNHDGTDLLNDLKKIKKGIK